MRGFWLAKAPVGIHASAFYRRAIAPGLSGVDFLP